MNHIITRVVEKIQILDDEKNHCGFLFVTITGRSANIGALEGRKMFFYVLRDMPKICKDLKVNTVFATMAPDVFVKFKKHESNLEIKVRGKYFDEDLSKDMLELEIKSKEIKD